MTLAGCLWLGLFPLLILGSYAHITLDKWQLMLGLTAVTLICFLPDFFLRRLSPPHPLPVILCAGIIIAAILSCLFGPYDASVWWIGASPRREGLATQLCYTGLFLMFCFSRIRLQPLLYAACAGLLCFLTVVLLQRTGINALGLYPAGTSFASHPEFQGTIGNVDMGTGYLCLLSGFFLSTLESTLQSGLPSRLRGWLPVAAGLAGMGMAVFLILTMEVQFGFLTLCALLLAFVLRHLPRRSRLIFLIAVCAAALLLVWFWPGSSGGVWELKEILHGRPQLSFGSNRLAVWLYSLKLARNQLFLGSGCDTFILQFNDFLSRSGLSIPTSQNGVALPHYFDQPHNEYLAYLIHGGLPALVLFTALLL